MSPRTLQKLKNRKCWSGKKWRKMPDVGNQPLTPMVPSNEGQGLLTLENISVIRKIVLSLKSSKHTIHLSLDTRRGTVSCFSNQPDQSDVVLEPNARRQE